MSVWLNGGCRRWRPCRTCLLSARGLPRRAAGTRRAAAKRGAFWAEGLAERLHDLSVQIDLPARWTTTQNLGGRPGVAGEQGFRRCDQRVVAWRHGDHVAAGFAGRVRHRPGRPAPWRGQRAGASRTPRICRLPRPVSSTVPLPNAATALRQGLQRRRGQAGRQRASPAPADRRRTASAHARSGTSRGSCRDRVAAWVPQPRRPGPARSSQRWRRGRRGSPAAGRRRRPAVPSVASCSRSNWRSNRSGRVAANAARASTARAISAAPA